MVAEISAEMLLEYLYPGMENQWKVTNCGGFYRNYQPDVKSLDPASGEISLSRNGYLHLLPPTFISPRDEIVSGKNRKEQYERLKKRKQILSEAFKPLDIFAFRERLEIEKKTSELLEMKLNFILKTFFGVDYQAIESPLVRKAAVILPYISLYRGNMRLIKDMIASILDCPVQVDLSHRYSERESFLAWMPEVRFIVCIPGLDPRTYREKTAELAPFTEFLREWFMPYDVHTEILVREGRDRSQTDGGTMLDYNGKLL